VIVVVMIVIMVMMVIVIMVVIVIVVMIMVIMIVELAVMMQVGGHDTRQPDRVMRMVVAVTAALACRELRRAPQRRDRPWRPAAQPISS
jgi:hypothetical protein